MTWTFLLLLLLPTGETTTTPTGAYATRETCEHAREIAFRQPLPTGVDGRLIGACREVAGS